MASELYNSLMRDFCVKSYRESFDRIGWLWDEDRANHELEQVYQILSCHAVIASVGKQRVLACVWDRPRGHKLIQKENLFIVIRYCNRYTYTS